MCIRDSLSPTTATLSIHADSLTGRSQRRTTGHQHPELRLLVDPFLLQRHVATPQIRMVLRRSIELAMAQRDTNGLSPRRPCADLATCFRAPFHPLRRGAAVGYVVRTWLRGWLTAK